MSNNSSLHQLKRKYRTRYFRNRSQGIPDLKPEDNAVSFLNNYLNITVSHSENEDDKSSPRANVAGHLKIEKTQEKKVKNSSTKSLKNSSTKSRVNYSPQHCQGDGHSMIKSNHPALPNALERDEKQLNVCEDKLFSDEESDNEETYMVAKLIEESLPESDDLLNRQLNNFDKPREKLYSSDTSVVQRPPSPSSNMQAKKWLSFEDSPISSNNIRTSKALSNNSQQLKQQNAVDSNNVNPNCANITYDLHTESTEDRLKDKGVLNEERSHNVNVWISPFKRKTASSSITIPKDNKPIPTPKKTNLFEIFSGLQKKTKYVKVPWTSSATADRSEDVFVIEETSSYKMDPWLSLSEKGKEDKQRPTPKKSNSVEAFGSLQKKSETMKKSLVCTGTAERSEDVFVIEETSSYKMDPWLSLSEKGKEDKQRPTPKKSNSVEAFGSLQKKSETMKKSLVCTGTAERRQERVAMQEQSCNLNAWKFLIKKKASPSSTKPKEDHKSTPVPKKPNSVELPYSSKKKDKNLQGSQISLTAENRLILNVPQHKIIPSSVNEEEFEIEDLEAMDESSLFTIPVKAKSLQTGRASKRGTADPHLLKTDKPSSVSELEMIKAADPQVVEDFEQEVVSSSDGDFPQVVDDIEKMESIHQDDLLIENEEENNSFHVEKANSNQIKEVQQVQKIKHSLRILDDGDTDKSFGYLDNTFDLKLRKGKLIVEPTGAARNTKKLKPQEKKQENNIDTRRKRANVADKKGVAVKKAKKTDKHGKSSESRNKLESAKDSVSSDLEMEEVLETSVTKRASSKTSPNIETVETEENTLYKQPHHESSEINNGENPQTGTDTGFQSKKRKAKMKNINTPCPADHNKEYSAFESGPVTRQRSIAFGGPMKPLICDLGSADIESEEEEISNEVDEVISSDLESEEEEISSEVDEVISSGKEKNDGQHFTDGSKTRAQISEEHEEFLKRYSVVFDPDTRSDVLVECIAQSENSEFVGSDYFTYWHSFNNDVFSSGKLIIAPRKKIDRQIFITSIMIYYIEEGEVQVNLHKSEKILKDGDFFFVPPGNIFTITNLQDKNAVLVYNVLKMLPGLANNNS
ncbi:centromere protein C isoform 2-T2 [Leptodactylus fuscus]|uniref:centromere protein C isoform X2 n=1 Tax=Leptodactylus fuscus TaxID=238119 RepID=UPI003F4E92BB